LRKHLATCQQSTGTNTKLNYKFATTCHMYLR